jgi:hypothetical protein
LEKYEYCIFAEIIKGILKNWNPSEKGKYFIFVKEISVSFEKVEPLW